MNPPRLRTAPKICYLSRVSLDPSCYSSIDNALKHLKIYTRRLHTVITTHDDELQILERLYYKGKNQHRSALFWRHVVEMRRYAIRLNQISLSGIVDSFRFSFFGEGSEQTPKILRASWTHVPDIEYITFVLERLTACSTLTRCTNGY